MKSALDTYLGWDQPKHHRDCKRPAWDIGIRTDEDVARAGGHMGGAVKHDCSDEFCSHRSSFTQTTVRIVCHSCGAAQVIYGEKTDDTGTTLADTRRVAYGLPPRQKAGLLLWPAQPWHNAGRAHDPEPYDFVVTALKVKKVTEETVVGQITQSRGAQGGVVWTALAVPHPDGQYGAGQRLHWLHANDSRGRGGSPLRTITAAARWINARVAEGGESQ